MALRHPDSLAAPPCVLLYQGPESGSDQENYLRDWILASGLPSLTLSYDKARGQTRKAFELALRHMDAEPHIVLDMHGNLGNRHGVMAGGLLGEPKAAGVPTADLLASMACRLRRPGHGLPVIHVLSCKSGGLAGEIVPGSDRWQAAYVMLYAGQHEITLGQIESSFNAALRYVTLCRHRRVAVDPLRLFLLAGLRRGDCMTLLGGDLKAPVRWHGPKSAGDLSDSRRLAGMMDGHPDDLERLARVAGTTRPDEEALLPEVKQAEVDIFFSRLIRQDHAALLAMLQQRPDLANAPDCEGSLPLMMAIDDCSIESIDLLVRHGADLDMRDRDGDTPLLHLVKTNFHSWGQARALSVAARLLALGANPDQRDSDGDSVLACAVRADWIELVSLLLARGADPGSGNDAHGALAIARQMQRSDIAEIIRKAAASE